GFQYEEGKTYEQDAPARLCSTGFHATIDPLDVLRYYPASQSSVYHRVELEDVDPSREEDTKVAGRKIRVGVRLSLTDLIKATIEFRLANSKPVAGATSKAKNAQVGTDAENGAATASGYSGAATASGDYGAATA